MVAALVNTLAAFTMKFVYFLNEKLYSLILTLGDINLFGGDKFKGLSNRIFIFAGVFMLFKLAITVINYVLDPDKLVNTQSGFQKVIIRILIALALLTAYDSIFTQAMKLQQLVLEDGVLNKIVFGESCSNEALTNAEQSKLTTNYISYTMIAPFIYYNDDAFANLAEAPEGCDNDLHVTPFNHAIGKMDICSSDGSENNFALDDACYLAIWTEDAAGNTNKSNFEKALVNYDLPKAWSYVAATKRNGAAVFGSSIFTPLLGMLVVVILFIICVKVAVRTVKLAFLRLVAPLPIISYIDISSGDKGMFKKWLKTVVDTYLELFIQLIALYFAIFLISQFIGSGNLVGYSGVRYSWTQYPFLNIFMLVACFMFALQMPKLIQDMTGFDTSGIAKITNKIQEKTKTAPARTLNAVGAGAAGFFGGLVTGGAAAINHAQTENISGARKGLSVVGNALTGAVSSTVRGTINGFSNNSFSFKNIASSTRKAVETTRDNRQAAWAKTHTYQNDEVQFKADGSIDLTTSNEKRVGIIRRTVEKSIRPFADAAGFDDSLTKKFKAEQKAYDTAEVKLNNDKVKYEIEKHEHESKRDNINAQITNLNAQRQSIDVSVSTVSTHLGTDNHESGNGSIASKFNDLGGRLAAIGGVVFNTGSENVENGDFGIKLVDASNNSFDLGTMTYADYKNVSDSHGISNTERMSEADFTAIQNDYNSQMTIFNTETSKITVVESQIAHYKHEKDVEDTEIDNITKNIEDTDKKITNVRKAKETSQKNAKAVEKVSKANK